VCVIYLRMAATLFVLELSYFTLMIITLEKHDPGPPGKELKTV